MIEAVVALLLLAILALGIKISLLSGEIEKVSMKMDHKYKSVDSDIDVIIDNLFLSGIYKQPKKWSSINSVRKWFDRNTVRNKKLDLKLKVLLEELGYEIKVPDNIDKDYIIVEAKEESEEE